MKKLLITRPNHELVVNYLSTWSKDLIELAEEKGLQIKDLYGKLATRSLFEKYLAAQRPRLVLLNGHGNSQVVAGQDDEPLLIAHQNDLLLKGSLVHALSCDSSKELGKVSVDHGAEAYIGYTMPFTLLTDKNYECRPEKDSLANIFRAPALEAPRNLIKGKTVKESFELARRKYVDTIIAYSSSDAPLGSEQIRFALWTNLACLDLCCKDASIFV